MADDRAQAFAALFGFRFLARIRAYPDGPGQDRERRREDRMRAAAWAGAGDLVSIPGRAVRRDGNGHVGRSHRKAS